MKKILIILMLTVFCFPLLNGVIDTDVNAQTRQKNTQTRKIKVKKKSVKDDFKKVLANAKNACDNSEQKSFSNKQIKKITVCPVNIYNDTGKLSIMGSLKNIAEKYFEIRNLIYILSFAMLVFIWARAYWIKQMEWKKLFYTSIVIISVTILGLLIDWFILKGSMQKYIVDCKKPSVVWQVCSGEKGSVSIQNRNIIIMDKNGKILPNDDLPILNSGKNNAKKSMFF